MATVLNINSPDLDNSNITHLPQSRRSVSLFFFFLNFIYLFIFGCVGSSLLREGFSLVAVSGGYSSLHCIGLSLRWLLLLQSTGPRHMGFNSCGTGAQ